MSRNITWILDKRNIVSRAADLYTLIDNVFEQLHNFFGNLRDIFRTQTKCLFHAPKTYRRSTRVFSDEALCRWTRCNACFSRPENPKHCSFAFCEEKALCSSAPPDSRSSTHRYCLCSLRVSGGAQRDDRPGVEHRGARHLRHGRVHGHPHRPRGLQQGQTHALLPA